MLNGQAPHQPAMTFSNAASTADILFCVHKRADRTGARGLQTDPALLRGEESRVGLRLEKGEPEGLPRRSPARGTSPALSAPLSGQEDLGHTLSKPADPRGPCCFSSESSAQGAHPPLSNAPAAAS